jgi:hypothetical protein
VDRDPEERREETRQQREEREAASKGRKGDRRRREVPRGEPQTPAEPAQREEFPHQEERPQDGLGRPWWRRMFGG